MSSNGYASRNSSVPPGSSSSGRPFAPNIRIRLGQCGQNSGPTAGMRRRSRAVTPMTASRLGTAAYTPAPPSQMRYARAGRATSSPGSGPNCRVTKATGTARTSSTMPGVGCAGNSRVAAAQAASRATCPGPLREVGQERKVKRRT
ncbi:hypothetical protein GCM10008956_02530 [Deinococcus arenae]|uniref:Uncharacterized protein n=1 Tax=Deinococcus arenae TaxID=1452751 RepID=A0A8H9GLP3_9DEIO|nr:hypothetical protein GCM10008956_02530 [Deinococcus arenae]